MIAGGDTELADSPPEAVMEQRVSKRQTGLIGNDISESAETPRTPTAPEQWTAL